uniref:Uncharacterized protein n=1 Tax=Brassica campestris TaxID=3711 RepID=M4D0R7_BRACM
MTVLSSTDRDNAEKKVKSSYFDLPAMNVFVAFPQATPASKFPTCTSDYYHFSELLTPEEQAVRKSEGVHGERSCPHYDREFPFHIIPKLGALGVVGGSIKVMAVLATSQPMPLQQQRYLELMQAVGLLIWSLAWRRLWSSLALEKLLELKLLMGGACPWILFLHMFIVP